MNRRSLVGGVVAVVLGAGLVGGLFATRQDGDRARSTPNEAGLAPRTVTAGAVTVKIRPHHVDDTGAEFEVAFDTHSFDLGFDVAKASRLTVAGTTWPAPTWSGAGPGGHHREGTLRFASAGDAAGPVELSIAGLPAPVDTRWAVLGR